MMLALLIYSYANDLFSSRKIERATHRDVATRYLQSLILSLFLFYCVEYLSPNSHES